LVPATFQKEAHTDDVSKGRFLMRIKKEYLVLVAVIIALSLYLILRNPDRTQYQLPQLPDVSRMDVTKIEISKKGSSIELKMKDDIWRIAPQEYPANADRIRNLLDIMDKLSLTALVSESKAYNRYDLNEDKKITVKAWTGDTLGWEFDVGKATPSYKQTFVRLAGDHRVYQALGNLRPQFNVTVDLLRDKIVLTLDPKEIKEIEIATAQKSLMLYRNQVPVEDTASQEADTKGQPSPATQTVWQGADGKVADELRLNSLLNSVSNLRCQKYIDDRTKEEFTEPIYTLRLKGAKEYALSIFAKTDEKVKDYPAVSSENDYAFMLPAWLASKIVVTPEELFKKPETLDVQQLKTE
jgi:hypothetical protein